VHDRGLLAPIRNSCLILQSTRNTEPPLSLLFKRWGLTPFPPSSCSFRSCANWLATRPRRLLSKRRLLAAP